MIQGGNAKASLKKVATASAATRRMSMPAHTRKGSSNLEASAAFTRMQQMQDLRAGNNATTTQANEEDSDDGWSDED
jgi:hypothetical protein